MWAVIQVASGLPKPNSVQHMFGTWVSRLPMDLQRLVLLGAAATYWSIWLGGNDLVFEKKNMCSPVQVIFAVIHWLHTWAILQKSGSQELTVDAS